MASLFLRLLVFIFMPLAYASDSGSCKETGLSRVLVEEQLVRFGLECCEEAGLDAKRVAKLARRCLMADDAESLPLDALPSFQSQWKMTALMEEQVEMILAGDEGWNAYEAIRLGDVTTAELEEVAVGLFEPSEKTVFSRIPRGKAKQHRLDADMVIALPHNGRTFAATIVRGGVVQRDTPQP